jgi:hypothetical protein
MLKCLSISGNPRKSQANDTVQYDPKSSTMPINNRSKEKPNNPKKRESRAGKKRKREASSS